jgi:Do/DeqQ family serine protease
MSKKQFFFGLLFASLFGAILAIGGYKLFEREQQNFETVERGQNVHFSNFLSDSSFTVPDGLNFVYAAEAATPCVVHIKSTVQSPTAQGRGYGGQSPFEDMFRDFFGEQPQQRSPRPAQASGSGVIISADGYIVTNNHVIDQSTELEVTLADNRVYSATLVGTDPTTDIAVLKIQEEGLPYIKFGNSDIVKVGQWVLAVGNPFELTSTVTAGIVSAKGRNIRILRERYGIEAFIQTDAAVNPGNSGGALVNLKGELIGINTAIATPTGTYAGYSFAVPVSLVSKVVEDLIDYGVVQRAVLGIEIVDVNDPRLEEDVDDLTGVYVMGVGDESAAAEAGLEKGDVITGINGQSVASTAELQELVARQRPGDKIQVRYKRDGKTKTVSATLKNLDNQIKIVKNTGAVQLEGATFENVPEEEAKELEINGGVKITELSDGKWRRAGIKNGFIITSVDKRPVRNVNDLRDVLRGKEGGGILISGVYPDGEEAYYGLGW